MELISRLDEAHLLTVAVGALCMATLLIIRRVNRKILGPLIVVVGAILASVVLDFPAKDVAVVGPVPPGLPQLTIPAITVQDIFALLPAALALTILIYADEILTSRVFAVKHSQKVDANQEFVALGMANIGAGLLTGFPVALSASRTAVADQMGGKTQWVGLIAAVVTMFGVLTVGVLQGILVAVVLSLILVLYHISRPHDALLDDVDAAGSTVYRGVADKETALTEPGLIVYRFDAPLVFANAAFFTERLEALIANAGAGLKCIILDAEPISDFDSTAAEALETLDADLERIGVDLWIARANEPLRELLTATGLTKRLGAEHLYPSVRAAVVAYRAQFEN